VFDFWTYAYAYLFLCAEEERRRSEAWGKTQNKRGGAMKMQK